jgi:putative addiction module component (TIGR02574 family)
MTAKTKELFLMIESLPIDIKTTIVEKILGSLQPSQKDIDQLWANEAERRVREIKSGKVKTVSGEEVFREIKRKFCK